MASELASVTPQEIEAARAFWQNDLEDFDRQLESEPPEVLVRALEFLKQRSLDQWNDYRQNTSIMALEGYVAYVKRASELVDAGDPDEAFILNNYGQALQFRFSELEMENVADLNEAISLYQRASSLASGQKRLFTANLEEALMLRYHVTKSIADLGKVIEIQTASLNTTQGITPSMDDNNRLRLAANLTFRYEEIGNEMDLQAAFRLAQEAGVPDSLSQYEPIRQADWLHTAGVCHGLEFERTGRPSFLNHAIDALQLAIQKTPPDAPQLSVSMNSLGILLAQKYHITEAIELLDEAIKWSAKAAADKRPAPYLRARSLHSVATMYVYKYVRLLDVENLKRSVEAEQEAIDTTTLSSDRRVFQSTLASALIHLWRECKDTNVLHEAVNTAREVTRDMPEDYNDKAGMFLVLAEVLQARYEELKAEEDLDEYVQTVQTALEDCAKESPLQCTLLWRLGTGLSSRYQAQGHENDFENSVTAYEAAVKQKNGIPLHRIVSAFKCAKSLIKSCAWERIYRITDIAITILPKVSPRSLSRDDQEYVLGYLSGMASISCSSALKIGRGAYEALGQMEACRGIIAGVVIDSRSDVHELKLEKPGLFEEYTCVRELIAKHHSGVSPLPQAGELTLDQYIERLDALEDQIRDLKGFTRFQLPPLPETIRSLATSGAIVTFNVSEISSDAIIITEDDIASINLPRLKLSELEANMAKITGKGNQKRRDAHLSDDNEDGEDRAISASDELKEMLIWLWNVAVKPVLEHLKLLKYDKLPTQRLPCVWWVSSGLMGLAPIHAAGTHSEGSRENTLSHVVSSYSSTFKALEFCRKKPWMPSEDRKVLVVAMPSTPGYADLDLQREIAAIRAIFGPETRIRECPQRQQVIDELVGCTITHFACHGFCHPEKPDDSGLLLGREVVEELTVRDLGKIDYGVAQIAYLSACSTAEVRSDDLVDESIHLANMFQLIGYRHVIATLWGAYDDAAVEVARNFYMDLSTATNDEDHTVAYALHAAILKVREHDKDDIMSWAPFVHYGA